MEPTIETSISLQKALFNQAERLAQQLNISESHLFEMAIEHFIKNYRSPTLLDKINDEINSVDQGQPAPSQWSKSSNQDAKTPIQTGKIGGRRMGINQGDIYWVQLDNPNELESGIPHPYVVVQENLFNHSRLTTVVACALTSNIRRVNDTPGNILLDINEGNLPKQSVIEVSKISTVDKMQLGEYIGSLNEQRVNQILTGMRFLQKSYFAR